LVLAATGNVGAVLDAARSQLGVPYRWGGSTPGVGFDCSGLTMWAYKQIGINLPHFTGLQVLQGQPVTRDQLQPGDLVFPDPGHVQIYSGNGNVIEAPHTGANVREVPMWGFWKARRLVASTQALQSTQNISAGSVASAAASMLLPGLPSFSELFANSRHFALRLIEIALGLTLISLAVNKITGFDAAGKAARLAGSAVKGAVAA